MADRRVERGGWLAALLLPALMALTCWPVAMAGLYPGRMASDQLLYHEVVVRVFAREFPHLGYHDYLSATTPGYHTLLAAVVWAGVEARWALQLIASAFTLGLVALLGGWLARRAGEFEGLLLALPVALSLYVWPAGVWLLPDNAAWLGVLAVVLLALRPRTDWKLYVLGGLVLGALVFTRQIHVWSAGVLWLAAWLGGERADGPDNPGLGEPSAAELLRPRADRLGRAALAVAASLPALAIVLAFLLLWKGLTPPTFQDVESGRVGYHGGNPATAAFILALVGLVSLFYGGYLAPVLGELARRPWWLAAAVAVGLLASLLPETTFSKEAGRWTGLWNVAARFPVLAGRTSPLIVALAVLGAVAMLAWGRALRWRDRWVLLGAVVAFAAAQSSSQELWQRYVEPLVLILVALAAALAVRARRAGAPGETIATAWRWRLAGPVVLAVLFALLTVAKVVSSEPVLVAEHEIRLREQLEARRMQE